MHRALISAALAAGTTLSPAAAQAATTITVADPRSCTPDGTQCIMKQGFGDTEQVDASYEWIETGGDTRRPAEELARVGGPLSSVRPGW